MDWTTTTMLPTRRECPTLIVPPAVCFASVFLRGQSIGRIYRWEASAENVVFYDAVK